MTRERGLRSAQKVLDRGSTKQPRSAAEAYLSTLKTLEVAEFCF
jgi:hypothetical protein